jgi:hypothetical protein
MKPPPAQPDLAVGPAASEPQSPAPPFAEHVTTLAHTLRTALSGALAACAADPTRPQQLGRQLKLDKSLAWKLARVVTDADPLAAVTRLPGRSGLQLAYAALARAGAPLAQVRRVEDAVNAIDEAIELHAGDRESFEMMLAELSPAGQERYAAYRELAFKGLSATFGVRAMVHHACQIVVPSAGPDPAMLDLVTISGMRGLVWLRRGGQWPIAHLRRFSGDGQAITGTGVQPVDELGVTPDGMMLVREFSSPVLPPTRAIQRPGGLTRFEIELDRVGNTATVDCVTGWYEPALASRYRTPVDTLGEHLVHTLTPCELLIFDLAVHASLDFAQSPELAAYGLMPGAAPYPQEGREKGLIPLEARVEALTFDQVGAATPEIDRYDRLVALGVRRAGADPREFVIRRARVPFPPMPAQVVLRYPLPTAPTRG